MKNRGNKILELLTKDNKIEVSHLAEELGVSQVTMRKDLDTLESKGVIKREHGFALLCSTDDINGRIAYHYEEKRKIAQKAAGLVSNGDTIMIENGSCCALLADTLTATKKDLTIITNSAFIAEYIRGKSNFQIDLLGGIYQQDSQVMVGPMILQCVENFLQIRRPLLYWNRWLFYEDGIYQSRPDACTGSKRYGKTGRRSDCFDRK